MPRSDPQPVSIGKRPARRRVEDSSLLVKPADQPVSDFCHFFASEYADQMVDLGTLLQELFFVSLGQTAGDNHAANRSLAFQVEHLVDRGKRFIARPFD